MKIIFRVLLVSCLLLAIVSTQQALAGRCGPTGCDLANPAPPAQAASSAASASHAFTATGGTRVAEHNLSPEARDVINAAGKEPSLPKGARSAADREKLIAKQPPLYGWPEDPTPRRLSRTESRSPNATRLSENTRAKVRRSQKESVKQQTTAKVAVARKTKAQKRAGKKLSRTSPESLPQYPLARVERQ